MRLCIIKHGCGNWAMICRHFPLKTCNQINNQVQRMFGQQSLAPFFKLHLDPKPWLDVNKAKKNVKRKMGCIVNTGDRLTRSQKMALVKENSKFEVAKEIRDQITPPIMAEDKPKTEEERLMYKTAPRALNKMIHIWKAITRIHRNKKHEWIKKKHYDDIWKRRAEDEALYAALVAKEASGGGDGGDAEMAETGDGAAASAPSSAEKPRSEPPPPPPPVAKPFPPRPPSGLAAASVVEPAAEEPTPGDPADSRNGAASLIPSTAALPKQRSLKASPLAIAVRKPVNAQTEPMRKGSVEPMELDLHESHQAKPKSKNEAKQEANKKRRRPNSGKSKVPERKKRKGKSASRKKKKK